MGDRSSLCGVLVVDKPAGMTSFGVVKRLRQRLKLRKAGHTGTLDPMATGVLPVCVGEATKIAGLLTDGDKVYSGTAMLGVETDTLDITGQVVTRRDPGDVNEAVVRTIIAGLEGPQLQVPPAYSAVHSGGERAHAKARRGEAVELEPREIRVHRFEMSGWEPPCFDLLVECSKGTYIRSLVAEVGKRLGCGATLTALRRLRSGPFGLDLAVTLPELERGGREGGLPLISPDRALSHLPAVELEPNEVSRVRHGQAVDRHEYPHGVLRMRFGGALIALGEGKEGKIWPRRVLQGP